MADPVLISVCIPAFKRVDGIRRLLDSIRVQTFKNYEVIISDDSPGDEIGLISKQYDRVWYHKNDIALGTPANWNQATQNARGKWIKLMHDDDWFADENSLQVFADAIEKSPGSGFFFSAYKNVFLNTNKNQSVFISAFRYRKLLKNPVTLFSRNVIGPPSVCLYRADKGLMYDSKLKWLVDIDFYMRWGKDEKPIYIDRVLINVGISDDQVTHDCFRQRPIEIPENFYLLHRVGPAQLKNLLIYDAWWRLMRNLEIRKISEIRDSGYQDPIPGYIESMIGWQKKIPLSILKIGWVSKVIMTLHYISHYANIKN